MERPGRQPCQHGGFPSEQSGGGLWQVEPWSEERRRGSLSCSCLYQPLKQSVDQNSDFGITRRAGFGNLDLDSHGSPQNIGVASGPPRPESRYSLDTAKIQHIPALHIIRGYFSPSPDPLG
jgi:hypothetical protein